MNHIKPSSDFFGGAPLRLRHDGLRVIHAANIAEEHSIPPSHPYARSLSTVFLLCSCWQSSFHLDGRLTRPSNASLIDLSAIFSAPSRFTTSPNAFPLH